MINLYINEMIKIVKKKSFLIFMIILTAFVLLTNFLYTKLDSFTESLYNDFDEEIYEGYKESYESGEREPMFLESYVQYKSQHDKKEIMNKYGKDSWQYNYLEKDETLYNYLSVINGYEIGTNRNEESYNENKKACDEFIKKLDSLNWKEFVTEKKEQAEKKIKEIKDSIETVNKDTEISKYEKEMQLYELNSQLKLAELEKTEYEDRLNKDIGYNHKLNATFEGYYSNKKSLEMMGEVDFDDFDAEDYQEYGTIMTNVEMYKYRLDNNIETTSAPRASDLIASFFNEYSFFILIFILMISGAIVSQEFSKGTIKLLLIKPYSRFKILLSKYFAALTSIIIVAFVGLLLQLIIGSIFLDTSSLGEPIFIYSSVSDKVISMNVFVYWFKEFLANLPTYIMIGTLSFAASTLFSNTALAVITGFAGTTGCNIIESLLQSSLKTRWWAKYFIGFHMNFENYIFGFKTAIKELTFGFSLGVWLVHLAILLIVTFIVFIKKDVKNT